MVSFARLCAKRALFAILLLVLTLCACVVPSGTSSAKANEMLTSSPYFPTARAEETPFSINPLSDYYRLWRAQSQPHAFTLTAALSLANTAEALRLSLALSEHLIALSEIGVTVCRLFGDDASGYSGTVEGAALGEGSISAPEGGVYAFRFTYATGSLFEGEYQLNESLHFSFGERALDSASPPSPFGAPFVFVPQDALIIEKTKQGWTSSVERDNVFSSFTCTADELVFIYGNRQARLSGGALELGPAPTQAQSTPAQ